MPAWTPKEKLWREWLRAKLIRAGVWDEFERQRMDFQRAEKMITGQCGKIVARKAWHKTAALFSEYFDQAAFEKLREKQVKRERVTRKRESMKRARSEATTAAQKAIGPLTEKELDHIIDPQDDDVVVIADAQEGDILRDTKWVYFNLARLIKVGRGGTKTLDRKVLREAPSNGAVGLAQYALEDQKAFMEKFVTKILPRDDNAEKAQTEEEAAAELDPTLSDLAKYMKKM